MRLVDRLGLETSAFHTDVDGEPFRVGSSLDGYRLYLSGTFGFVAPIERAITTTPGIERYLDLRRFNKAELLRRDLAALRIGAAAIKSLAQCSVPLFTTPEQGLGWAYFVERSTLAHNATFMQFAAAIPGDVAFASSYLKCYFGSVGEMWRGFADALDAVTHGGEQAEQHVFGGAKAAFQTYRSWSETRQRKQPTSSSGEPSPGDDFHVS